MKIYNLLFTMISLFIFQDKIMADSGEKSVALSNLSINNLTYLTTNEFVVVEPNLGVPSHYNFHRYYFCNSNPYTQFNIDFSISGGVAPYSFHWSYVYASENYTDGQLIDHGPLPFSENPYTKNLIFNAGSIYSPSNPITFILVVTDNAGNKTTRAVAQVEQNSPVQPVITNLCVGAEVKSVVSNWSSSNGPTFNTFTYPNYAQLVSSNNKDEIKLKYATPYKASTLNFSTRNACGTYQASTTYTTATRNPVTAGNPLVLCLGYTATLVAWGGTTYEWSPSTGLSATNIAYPQASPTTTTTYTVTSVVNGCTYSAQKKVWVNSSTTSATPRWITAPISSFYTEPVDNVVSDKMSNQIYYRTIGNAIHSLWYNQAAGEWQWSGLCPVNNCAGDLAVAPNGQVFYRTTDNKINSIYWTNANGWQKTTLNNSANNVQGPIVATNSQVFYRTTDNKIQSIYQSSGSWYWSGMSNVASGNVGNAMVMSSYDGKLYYRTGDNKLNCLYWENNDWHWTNLNNVAGNNVGRSIAVAPNGQIFFKTTGGSINSLYMNNGSWAWSGLNNVQNVSGDLISDSDGKIFYRKDNGLIHQLYWTPANGWQSSTLNNATADVFDSGYPTHGVAASSDVPYDNFTIPSNGGLYFRTLNGGIPRLLKLSYLGFCDHTIPSSGNYREDLSLQNQNADEDHSVGITAFPNPGNDVINLNSSNEIIAWTIYTLQGEAVLTSKDVEKTTIADVSGLANGIYVMQVKDVNHNMQSIKIIVQH